MQFSNGRPGMEKIILPSVSVLCAYTAVYSGLHGINTIQITVFENEALEYPK